MNKSITDSAFVISSRSTPHLLRTFFESFSRYSQGSGLDISVFRAVEENDFCALGRVKSHLMVLTYFLTLTSAERCLLFEDTFLLTRPLKQFFDEANKALSSIGEFDAMLLGGDNVKVTATSTGALYRVVESESSYGCLVSRKYVPHLISTYSEVILQMERFRHVHNRDQVISAIEIENVWKRLQLKDQWLIISPAIGKHFRQQ